MDKFGNLINQATQQFSNQPQQQIPGAQQALQGQGHGLDPATCQVLQTGIDYAQARTTNPTIQTGLSFAEQQLGHINPAQGANLTQQHGQTGGLLGQAEGYLQKQLLHQQPQQAPQGGGLGNLGGMATQMLGQGGSSGSSGLQQAATGLVAGQMLQGNTNPLVNQAGRMLAEQQLQSQQNPLIREGGKLLADQAFHTGSQQQQSGLGGLLNQFTK